MILYAVLAIFWKSLIMENYLIISTVEGGYGSQASFQGTGYSYAMLTPQLQLKTKFYDPLKSYISLRVVKAVDSNNVLGITNNSGDQSPFDSLSYFNSNTGQIFWSIQGYASMHSVWLESKVLADAYVFSDSVRVFKIQR